MQSLQCENVPRKVLQDMQVSDNISKQIRKNEDIPG